MSEPPSKFAGLFDDRLNKAPTPTAFHERKETPSRSAERRSPGRRPGKRSHPDYKPHTILLRKQLHQQATARLREKEGGPDLSELFNQLLERWLKQPGRS